MCMAMTLCGCLAANDREASVITWVCGLVAHARKPGMQGDHLRSPHASLCKQFGNRIVELFGEQPNTIENLKFFRIVNGCVVSVIAGDEPIPVI